MLTTYVYVEERSFFSLTRGMWGSEEANNMNKIRSCDHSSPNIARDIDGVRINLGRIRYDDGVCLYRRTLVFSLTRDAALGVGKQTTPTN